MILAKVCFLMNWIESKKFGILRCYIHVMFLPQGSYGERTTFEHWANRDTESNIILRSSDNQVFHEKRVSTFSLLSNVWNQILKRSLNSFLWNIAGVSINFKTWVFFIKADFRGLSFLKGGPMQFFFIKQGSFFFYRKSSFSKVFDYFLR